jgi:hypothetical protein
MRATQIVAALAVGVSDGVMFGPHVACFAELFGPSLRYSVFAFARELGSIVSTFRLPLFPRSWFDGWCALDCRLLGNHALLDHDAFPCGGCQSDTAAESREAGMGSLQLEPNWRSRHGGG